MSRVYRIILLAVFMNCNVVLAQNTFSPYTVLGIGDLSGMGMSNNVAMGNVGIGTPTIWHINNMNPAFLVHNKLTVFAIGVQGENREITNDLNSISVGTGGFKYLSFAFPIISSKWVTNLGIMPYSSVNYSFSAVKEINGTANTASIEFDGTGGLNQLYFSNGIDIGNGFSIGVRGSFIFGLVKAETTTLIIGDNLSGQLPTGVMEKTNYSGFTYGLATAYQKTLSEEDVLNFGITYDFQKSLKGSRLVRNQRQTSTVTIPGDTLVNDQQGYYDLPVEIGFGLSWEKINKITIGFDVKRSLWDKNAGFGEDAEEYKGTWQLGLGFEFIPKHNDVNSYFNRIRYRIGVNYEQNPHVIDGKTINDIGINFGWSLPILGVSALDMSFKYAQRGSTTDSLVKEKYWKFVLGVTINDRWFVRRKYN